MIRRYPRPTARQLQVLEAVLDAGSIVRAAEGLGISPRTAASALSDLRRRVGVPSNERLCYIAGRDGWFRMNEYGDELHRRCSKA